MEIDIKGYSVIIDDEDFERVSSKKWNKCGARGPYFHTFISKDSGRQKFIRLHRFIMNVPTGLQVDHVNMDTLDNRKCNLRIVTNKENSANKGAYSTNTSGYKGVSWHKTWKKYIAQIMVSGKSIKLGGFDDPKMAHEEYCKAAKKYFGEYARF